MSIRPRIKALALLAALMLLCSGASAETELPLLAIAAFDYNDSSGEVGDQTAAHAARLGAFGEGLRADLQAGGSFRTMALGCAAPPCSAGHMEPEALLGAARRAGARYLLFGGIHKESTLIEWARVEMIDVASGALVYDKLITFRGDSDEAWRHAQRFIASALKGVESR